MEKFITTRIESYLEVKDFFRAYQNGFGKGKSTASAMSKFLDDIILGLNESTFTVAAYLDVQKAFDTIKETLLAKLGSYGLCKQLCKLLENYLSNMKQKITFGNGLSDFRSIFMGVPQGSTIDPIMFIIYINDLSDVLVNSKLLMYADYTVLYHVNDNCCLARKGLQSDPCKVEQCMTVQTRNV